MNQAEIPPGIEIEQAYLVEVQFTPGAAERRPAVRHQHLVRIAELKRAGTLIEGGAYADGSLTSSILIVRTPDAEAAEALVRADVYVAAGVWGAITVRPFGRVVVGGDGDPVADPLSERHAEAGPE